MVKPTEAAICPRDDATHSPAPVICEQTSEVAMSDEIKLGRRGLVKGATLVASAAALLQGAGGTQGGKTRRYGPGPVEISLEVNGEPRTLKVEPRTTLVHALREDLGLTGTKIGCDRGACGACTVLVGETAVPSCMTFALDLAGKKITTIEGLAAEGHGATGARLSPVQAAFVAHDALQCGFCTPGMVMACHALLQRTPHPSEDQVRDAVSGNLCRCGTYPKVFEAVMASSATAPVPLVGADAKSARGESGASNEAGANRNKSPVVGGTVESDAKKSQDKGGGGAETAFAIGVLGALHQGDRKVPDGEPKAWDGNAKLSVVGKPTPRLEGAAKVTGQARYVFDVKLPGMLYAATVRSPHAHARVRGVDVSAAAKMPGVKATYIIERILGPAELRLKATGPGKFPRVRFEGQPIAAVAAVTQAQAEDAARRIQVDYQVLPHVSDIDEAQRPGSPLVFEGPVEQPSTAGGGGAPKGLPQRGNIRGPLVVVKPEGGDIEKALSESATTVDATFRTDVQTHSAMETHGAVSDWRDDGVTIYCSTQGLHSVQNEIATLFGLSKSKVHVICEYTGGGFGAKFGAANYGVIAMHLSRKAKAPVRLFLDRRDEHLSVGNRPSSIQHLRLGADKEGKLLAIDLIAQGSAGCAAGAGCAGPAKNLYPAKVVRTSEEDVFLHTGPAAAFRAPGHPQGAFALEQAMDELAQKLGLDPLELRERNDAHPARREERRIGAQKFGWAAARARKSPGLLKRGVGFAQGLWYNFDGPHSSAEVIVHDDGSIECRSGVADIGGGIRTACAQVVAEVLGVRPEEVRVRVGDTSYPEGPPSGGSMTTQLLTPAVRVAAEQVHAQLALSGGDVRKPGKTLRGYGERARDYGGWRTDPYTATIGGAQFAEVEVDTETGIVRVLRVLAVHVCGRPVNRLALESQINGGIVQGVSYALHERRVLDLPTGRMVNANLEQYRIAGSKDVPMIESIIVENYLGRTNTDVSGIGEPATVPTSGAIANAIAHATGVRMRELPMTPARVLAALRGKS